MRPAGAEVARNVMRVVLRAYRTTDYVDAEAFVRLAIAALEDEPEPVLRALADPKQGILRTSKFPPTIAELVTWCASHKAPLEERLSAARMALEARLRVDQRRAEAERERTDAARLETLRAQQRDRASLDAKITAEPNRYVTAYEARR